MPEISAAVFASIGLGLMSLSHEYLNARYFFAIAGTMLALKFGLWVSGSVLQRWLVALLAAVVAGHLINYVNDWVTALEIEANLILEAPHIQIIKGPQPTLVDFPPTLELQPIVTVHRTRSNGEFLKGAQYGVTAVVRINNSKGASSHQVRSLQIVGDVPADCTYYMMAFFPDLHGQYTTDFLDKDCVEHKPFFQLSWISWPRTNSAVLPHGEQFVTFIIANPFNILSFIGEPKDYFGFSGSQRARPKYPLTTPDWDLLIQFTGTNLIDSTGIGPEMRDEIKQGKIKLRVQIDQRLVDIPVKQIRRPYSWPDYSVEKVLPQELFYNISNNERGSAPTGPDPLVKTHP